MAATHVGEGDRGGAWTWGGMHQSGDAPEIKPADVNVSPQIGHVPSKIGGQSGPSIPIQPSGPGVVNPTIEKFVVGQLPVEPEVPQQEKQTTDLGASVEKNESAKHEEPRIEPREEKKIEEQKQTTGEETAQPGDKRKADEVAALEITAPKENASTEDKEAKKPKTSTAATNDLKKQPETAKPVEKKPRGSKKEKKVPRTGTAQRKTRSQGAASDATL